MIKNVSVIIPNWNGKHLLEKNLPAVLLAKKQKENRIAEIIVVDDASSDDSVEFLKKNYAGEVRIVRHTKQRGFSSGVNTGARSAKNTLLCLLNSDVSPSEKFLVAVLPHFRNEKLFAVSLCEEGERKGYAVGKFEEGFIIHRGSLNSKFVHQTFWANGGSSVFRRDVWMKLGGMDEKLLEPFYWEDVDLSYRAQKRGYTLLWEPKSTVIHNHESTINVTNFKKGYMDLIKERNQLLVVWKNITSVRLVRKHIQGLIKRIVKHPGYLRVVLAALPRLGMALKEKLKEKKESTVSDEAIFAKFA